MLSRSALAKGSRLAPRRPACANAVRRGFAAAAAPSASYEPTTIAGVKVASRDDGGPTTRLIVAAKAGTRYQPVPGMTVGLEEFAFKNTLKRSALRIVRESELLGGQLTAYHTRETLVLQANFLREHLPYYAELLAEVISQTKYTTHEFREEIEGVIKSKQAKLDAATIALDTAHAVAFHTGLGNPLYPATSDPMGPYLSEHAVAEFAESAYPKDNIALVADGASQAGLAKWVEPFFTDVAPTSENKLLNTGASKYYGGEQRTAHVGPSAMVIAFPGFSLGSNKPETAVLSALLGGESSISWTPGFSLLAKAAAGIPGVTARAAHYAYSDAGLVAITITGSAGAVRAMSMGVVKAIKDVAEGQVAKEDLTKAIAKAKFDLLAGSETSGTGLVSAGANLIHGGAPLNVAETLKSLESVTVDNLKTAAKAVLDGKSTVATVGDLYVLPYAEEIGLKV